MTSPVTVLGVVTFNCIKYFKFLYIEYFLINTLSRVFH